ncbi:hypothetical protein AB2E09_25925 (plasmid) [Escherichia coli]|uniref:hypothetical protein n=1 Tax=Enterobacteriaceae TaxID=543 RepID=UPI00246909FB|nr:hypothetical protein [Enterobacter cloacae]WGL84745.1 hypothetical protein QFB83_23440 [Enterobacter cloacae]
MLENYVCKIYVSDNSNPSSFREATAFGFDDGTSAHLLTAAHVVTDVLGKKYPSSNNQKLYVIFHNHLGPVNTIPVPVEFILKDCNDQSNFQGNMPFVDSAKMILPSGMKQPVSHYFKRRPPSATCKHLGSDIHWARLHFQRSLGKFKVSLPATALNTLTSIAHLVLKFRITTSKDAQGAPISYLMKVSIML